MEDMRQQFNSEPHFTHSPDTSHAHTLLHKMCRSAILNASLSNQFCPIKLFIKYYYGTFSRWFALTSANCCLKEEVAQNLGSRPLLDGYWTELNRSVRTV